MNVIGRDVRTPQSVFSRRLRVSASQVAFAGYLLLTLVLTFPLLLHLSSHIPGGNVDEGAFLWNIWWMKHALLDLHSSPLSTTMIFYPLGVNLALYTLTPLNGVLALPLTLTFGPILASNVLFILGFALSGFAVYLLALDLMGTSSGGKRVRQLAAFLAGLIYAFASGHFIYAALGQYDYVCLQWLPLAVLFLLRTLQRPGRRAPVLAGLFAACAGLTEMNFVVFLFFFVLLLAAYLLFSRRDLLRHRAVWGRLALALIVFLIGFGPLGLAVVRGTLQTGDYLVRGWGGADRFVLDLFAPLLPSPLATILGGWARRAAHSFSDINFGFVGYATLILAGIGARVSGLGYRVSGTKDAGSKMQDAGSEIQDAAHSAGISPADALTPDPESLIPAPGSRHPTPETRIPDPESLTPSPGSRIPVPCSLFPNSRFWLLVAVGFFLLSLGPLLHVNGRALFDLDGLQMNVPLPYIIVHYLPILKGARVPGRFAIMATLALAVLAALGCRWALARMRTTRRQTVLAGFLALVIISENMALPLPLTNAVVPSPYQRIAAQPGDFAILQVPLGWRDGFGTVGSERTLLQSYQSVHGKRILGGNTSRSPDYVLSYFAQIPVLRSIIALETGGSLEPGVESEDRAQAADVLGFLDVRYIVVQGDFVGGPVDKYIQSVLPVQRLDSASGQTENSFWHFGDDGKWVETRPDSTSWALYAVDAAPHSVTSVDLGTTPALVNLAGGWSRPETIGDTTVAWAVDKQAMTIFRPEPGTAYTLSWRASPYSYPGAPVQSVGVAVNGHTLATVQMGDGWQEYQVAVPAQDFIAGINQVKFSFAHLASPAEVSGSSDTRTLAAAVDWIRLEK